MKKNTKKSKTLSHQKHWALPLAVAMLVGCQSVSPSSNNPKAVQSLLQDKSDKSAETALVHAFEKTAKSAFSYQTTMRSKMVALFEDDALGEALNCNKIHDRAYIALAYKAKLDGFDISADRYLEQKASIKADFLSCQKNEEARYQATLDASDDGALDKTPIVRKQDKSEFATKKIEQFNDYLFSASHVSITGNYRPLIGTLTMTPMARYDFSHSKLMLNQPIYVDLKSGDIYLWADNLALANATVVDKKLGLGWKNKWLKIPINDGSLPASFKDDFIKAYLSAEKKRLTMGNSRFVSVDDLPLGELSADEQKHIRQSKHIIAHSFQTTPTLRQSLAPFKDDMLARYPILKETPKSTLNSLRVMQALFAYLEKEAHPKLKSPSTATTEPMNAYGIDAKGRLAWVYHRRTLDVGSSQLLLVGFTKLDGAIKGDFERLPAAYRKPSEDSSINLFSYGNELKDSLMTSNQLYVRLLAGSLFAEPEVIEAIEEAQESTLDTPEDTADMPQQSSAEDVQTSP